LPEAAVEPLDDPGAIGAFITDLVPSGRDDSFVSTPPVRVEASLPAVEAGIFCHGLRALRRERSPTWKAITCLVSASIATRDPLGVGLVAHETPQLIGLRF